ncbi:MAG: hypothetical protein ACI4O7_14475 [Aristaeellaceae bacterium]
MAYLPDRFRCAAEASMFAAVYVEYMGMPEECREMECARCLAAWIADQPDGEEELQEYCRLSPAIVRAVRSTEGYEAVLDMLHVTYASPCIRAVDDGRMEDAFSIYRRMMSDMKAQWLQGSN